MSKSTTHQVVTMNMKDGSVQGHAAGCADLKRGVNKFAEPHQANYPLTVATKHEAWLEYNEDFLADGEDMGSYGIDWLPCAKHVPQGAPDTFEQYMAEQAGEQAPAEATPVTTVKKGSKWTYVYADGQLVAEIRNDQAHLLAAL